MGNFIDIVHEKYPEINLEAVPYSGQNYTAYVKAQLNSGDLPGRMPYLSEDGSQNSYILNVSRYIGLNKHLADAGNEQKLQDTGIVGLTAAQEYFSQFDTLSEKDLVW